MTLRFLNPLPRLLTCLKPLFTTAEERYVIVDVGSRGFPIDVAQCFKGMARIIGFEVDADECARLNALHPGGDERSYPYAIAEKEEQRTFYVTRFPYSSGLYPGNPVWLNRFPWRNVDTVREVQVTTTSLDAFADKEGIGHIDFIKADVEGAELEVFRGASRSLAGRAVLGIKTEFIWDPEVRNQPSFAELDTFLRGAGFRFFDLDLHYVYARSTLPVGRLEGVWRENKAKLDVSWTLRPFGQSVSGDALYFRDPVGDRRNGLKTIEWSDLQLLRLCGLFDAYDYGDCAIEILEEFGDQLSKKYDVDALIQAATPLVAETAVNYARYFEWSNHFRKERNACEYGDVDWRPKPRPGLHTK